MFSYPVTSPAGRERSGTVSVQLDQRDRFLRVHTPDMLINVRCLLAAQRAIRALVSRRLAAFVSKVAQHSVSPAVPVVTVRTVKFPGVSTVQGVPYLRELPRTRRAVIAGPATYKTSHQGQDRQPATVGQTKPLIVFSFFLSFFILFPSVFLSLCSRPFVSFVSRF